MKLDKTLKTLLSFILVLLVILVIMNLNSNKNQLEASQSNNPYLISLFNSPPASFLIICDTLTGKTWLYELSIDIQFSDGGKWVIEKPGQPIVEIDRENPLMEGFIGE